MSENPTSTDLDKAAATETDDVVSRQFLTRPGEPIFFGPHPLEISNRFEGFIEYTGLGPEETLLSPLAAIPLPVYAQNPSDPRRRWPDLKVDALWCPLFWLPAKSGQPRAIQDTSTSSTRMETPDELALRICLEIQASGLYDQDTGSFVDVLALVGIDLDQPEDRERCEAWLLGTPDAILDAIDLTPHLLYDEDEDWSVVAAQSLYPHFLRTSWASLCADFSDILSEIADPGNPEIDKEVEGVSEMIRNVFEEARLMLSDVEVSGDSESAGDFWNGMVERAKSSTASTKAELIDELVPEAGEWLEAVREHYSTSIDTAIESFEAVAAKLNPES